MTTATSTGSSKEPEESVDRIPLTIPLLVRRGMQVISRQHLMSIVDQAIVSGTSFGTVIAIARWSSAPEVGAYILGASLIALASALQDAIILQPYTVHCGSKPYSTEGRLGASLVLSATFALMCSAIVVLGCLIVREGALQSAVASSALFAGAIIPFCLARDFARRTAFASFLFRRALILDASVSLLQMLGLIWLAEHDWMSASTVWLAIGGANAASAAGWLYVVRNDISASAKSVRLIAAETWSLGKWLVVGRLAVQAQSYAVYWIIIALAGAAVTGVYAACTSIVNLANPLVLAIDNVMMPKMVSAWRASSGQGLAREALRNAALIGVPLSIFCAGLWVGGGELMRILYPGPEYEGQATILATLACALLATAIGSPASIGLATMERPRPIVAAAALGACVSVLAVWTLTVQWGLAGAAVGMLLGNAVGATARWVLFWSRLPRNREAPPVARVLDAIGHRDGLQTVRITRVGYGEQAEVYLVDFRDTQNESEALAIKLYRASRVSSDDVRQQFDALSELHESLDGLHCAGWRMRVPRPITICRFPLALVMTAVPGGHLEAHASERSNLLSREVLTELAEAFSFALNRYWSAGHRHADLGLRNALFDFEEKQISLIDAGTPDSCPVCSNLSAYPSHASADLAHVLRDAVRDVNDILGISKARLVKERFAEQVIRSSLHALCVQDDRQKMSQQILVCLEAHLQECLDHSLSPRGIAHRFVRAVAISRAHSIMNRVNQPPDVPTAERPVPTGTVWK